jgi:hypothetical protein
MANPADMVPVSDQGALQRTWRIAGFEVRLTVDVFGLGALIKKAIASSGKSAKDGPIRVYVRRLQAPDSEEVKP